jgi:hypothetical protein
MHRNLLKACVPLLAVAAFIVLPATASASPALTSPLGTLAPVGTKFKGTTIGATRMTMGSVTLECTSGANSGVLLKNTGTFIEGEIQTLEVSGTAAGGDCTSALGDFKVTTSPGNGLPYCMRTTKTADQLEIRGGSCSSAARPITYLIDFTSSGVSCDYERSTGIMATFTTTPNDATATQSEVAFSLAAGSSFFCPTSAKLDASITLENFSTGEPAYVS